MKAVDNASLQLGHSINGKFYFECRFVMARIDEFNYYGKIRITFKNANFIFKLDMILNGSI